MLSPTSSPKRGRRWLIAGSVMAVMATALAAFVLAYFQPQKLFIDDRVNEGFPEPSVA